VIGDAGYFLMPDQKRVELGYRLSRRVWGRGLATEVAAKWIEVAEPWFGFREVFAFAHLANTASLQVMRKLGFCFHQMEQLYGMEEAVYVRTISSNNKVQGVQQH
jgi:RimJ/RimL family protein N-acetyltransferase